MKNLKKLDVLVESSVQDLSFNNNVLSSIYCFSMELGQVTTWQDNVLNDGGGLSVQCPYTEVEVQCAGTVKVGFQFFFLFRLGNGKVAVLFTSDIFGHGFTVVGMAIPEDNYFCCIKVLGGGIIRNGKVPL